MELRQVGIAHQRQQFGPIETDAGDITGPHLYVIGIRRAATFSGSRTRSRIIGVMTSIHLAWIGIDKRLDIAKVSVRKHLGQRQH